MNLCTNSTTVTAIRLLGCKVFLSLSIPRKHPAQRSPHSSSIQFSFMKCRSHERLAPRAEVSVVVLPCLPLNGNALHWPPVLDEAGMFQIPTSGCWVNDSSLM